MSDSNSSETSKNLDPKYQGLDPRFPLERATAGIDDLTGDVFIYAGEGAASWSRNAWWPGIWFNKAHMLGFTAVKDPEQILEYLKGAQEALIKSLEEE